MLLIKGFLFYLLFMSSLISTLDKLIEMVDNSNYKSLAKNVEIPKQMQAIIVDSETKKLGLQTVDTPKLRTKEVMIKIEASAVNRADLLQASGIICIAHMIISILKENKTQKKRQISTS